MKRWLISIPLMTFSTVLWAEDIPATLQWSQRVELSTPVSGVVRSVDVEVGDLVKKGQILLSLDNTMFTARVTESQSEIIRLKAEMEEAQRELERMQGLYERTVVAATDLDQTRLKLTTSRASLAEAEARLKLNQKILDDSSIRAPFDAIVILRQAEPGMSIAIGLQPQTLLTVARSGQMIARMYLSSAQLDKMKIGLQVTVKARDASYSGKIKTMAVEPIRLKEDWLYPVDVLFPVGKLLRAGMPATVITK